MKTLGAKPFHQKTARDIFWGYKDQLVKVLENYIGPVNPEMRNIRVGLLETVGATCFFFLMIPTEFLTIFVCGGWLNNFSHLTVNHTKKINIQLVNM